MDVIFDQHFLSNISGSELPFAQAQFEIDIGKVGGPSRSCHGSTGDLTNLSEHDMSHWGEEEPHDTHCPIVPHVSDPAMDKEQPSDSPNPSLGLELVDGIRRSARVRRLENALACADDFAVMTADQIEQTFEELEEIFSTLETAAKDLDLPLDPYLPEPRSLADIRRLPLDLQQDWLAASKKELKFVIENETLDGGEEPVRPGDEVIPCMLIYKAKVTSRGFLDKLKARCVARGDLQVKSNDPEHLWSPCVFARTFKVFVAEAVMKNKPIKQLDFIGAFCQAYLKSRLFLQLPKEYMFLLPEYAKYFEGPRLLKKSLYGMDLAAKVWNQDLTEWLLTNSIVSFKQSQVDPSLYVHRNGAEYIFMVIYVDDSLYFGSSPELEKKFTDAMSERFKLELQGWSHWFLGTRLYREADGSYILDQENYVRHILNRYCGKNSPWGLPPFQSTPAPIDYVYSTANRPTSDDEKKLISSTYPD